MTTSYGAGSALAIDIGTMNTAACWRDRTGEVRVLRLGTGGDLMPSAVLAGPNGLLAGEAAVQWAEADPSALEPAPLHRLPEGTVQLGGQSFASTNLVSAVLAEVLRRAVAAAGGHPDAVVLVHPERWDEGPRGLLFRAAVDAGIPAERIRLESAAQAAAWAGGGWAATPGARIGVIDFGAGSCEAAVLQKRQDGSFTVLAADGVSGLGGNYLDGRMWQWMRGQLASSAPELLAELDSPQGAGLRAQVLGRIRTAKEQLSAADATVLVAAGSGGAAELTLTRGEFEQLMAEDSAAVVALARRVFDAAGAPDSMVLTGGSTLIPQVREGLGALAAAAGEIDPLTTLARGALVAPAGPSAIQPPAQFPPASAPPAQFPPAPTPTAAFPAAAFPSAQFPPGSFQQGVAPAHMPTAPAYGQLPPAGPPGAGQPVYAGDPPAGSAAKKGRLPWVIAAVVALIALVGGGTWAFIQWGPFSDSSSQVAGGSVHGWGDDQWDQVMPPAKIADQTVIGVAAGDFHSLALLKDHTVVAWGDDADGQISVPSALAGKTVVKVSAGESTSMALTEDGVVFAWGDDEYGQSTVPSSLTGKKIIDIAAGDRHALALDKDGTVYAWGRDSDGQATVPRTVAGKKIMDIGVGYSYSLALDEDGKVHTWGSDSFELGTLPSGLSGERVVSIAAGAFHSLALTEDGKIYTWGDSEDGQARIPGALVDAKVVEISAGFGFSLALTEDGKLHAWGIDDDDQLAVPAAVSDGEVVGISAGGYHSLAIVAD